MKSSSRGFTLIELLITVAVIAILAGVAYPGYQQHVRKSRRAEAQSFMMAFAARQQQFLLDTRAFATTVDDVGVPLPANVALAYTANMPAPTPSAFTLTLVPKAVQASEPCGTLSIDQNGTKTAAIGGCW